MAQLASIPAFFTSLGYSPAMLSAHARLVRDFLASPVAGGIEYIERADVRAVLERFLGCCAELGREPGELAPAELRVLLVELLPRRYVAREPLAQRTIDVLRTWLAFLEPELPPERARALRVALEQDADTFRSIVAGGSASSSDTSGTG